MQLTENFTERFHKLEGATLGKKKENFYKLLQSYPALENENTPDLTTLQPRTYLESNFKLDALIYFQKTTELLQILKEGNELFICKIIKQPWFIKEVFTHISPTVLVNEFLPFLSFSMRMKVLKKITSIFQETLIDEIFECLMERYGLSVATTVISHCSEAKIVSVLKNYQIKLTTGQLKTLFDKNPEVILIYLEEFKNPSNEQYKDQKLLTYIAQKNPEYFWKICDNYNCAVKLGRKSTTKMLPTKYDKLVNDPKKYAQYFRQDKMVRNLAKKNLFEKLYRNLFPKNTTQVEKSIEANELYQQLLKYYPKRGQYFLFERTFKEVTGQSIWKHLKCLDSDLLKTLKDTDVRERLALERYNETRNVEYVKYFTVPNSVKELKVKINATSSAGDRGKLIKLLIETCHTNNDLNALDDVLKYYSTRHRHADRVIRESCLQTILNNYEKELEKFTESHWKSINEILAIQRLNSEWLWNMDTLKIKHLEFLFNNNLKQQFENAVTQYLKDSDIYRNGGFDKMKCVKNPVFETSVYQYTIKVFPIIYKNADEKVYIASRALLLNDIHNHNVKNPNHKIEIVGNETLQQYLLESYKTDFLNYYTAEFIGTLACKTNRNYFENELKEIYFNHVPNKCPFHKKVIVWFLKNDPNVLEKYSKRFLDDYGTPHLVSSKKLRKHLHFHIALERKLIYVIKDQMESDNLKIGEIARLTKYLADTMPTQEYLEYCKEKLLDPSLKLDLANEKQKVQYAISRALISNMRYLANLKKILPVILKYCTSDYMQLTKPALYRAFFRIPENALVPYVNELLDKKPNTISKHAIFLSANVFTKAQNTELFKKFILKTNIEIYKNLIRSSLNYFIRNPCPETFEIASQYLNGLQNTDDETCKLIVLLKYPKMYKTQIIIKCWEVFENLRRNNSKDASKYDEYQFQLINSLDIDLSNTSIKTFTENVIQNYFLKTDESTITYPGVSQFVVKFLSSKKSKTEHFDFVFNIVKNFKSENWYINKDKRKFIHTFFNEFVKFTIENNRESLNNNITNEFMKKWVSIFSPIETFDEFIVLNLLVLKQDHNHKFGKSLHGFCLKICEEFGATILNTVSVNINSFMEHSPINEKLILYKSILEENENVKNQFIFVLIINLLCNLDMATLDVEGQTCLTEIDSILIKANDDIVKLHYSLYLKGVK